MPFLKGRGAGRDQSNFFSLDGKQSLKVVEPQVVQRHENVEGKCVYYIIIFPEKTENLT